MTTGLGIVTKALQKLGVLTKSEVPDNDEASDGLSALNSLLSSWSNEAALVYALTTESFTLSSGVGSYTIGPSGTFNTVRPITISSAYIRSGSIDYPLTIVNDDVYSNIDFKSQTGIPEFLNYTADMPLGTIKLWPVPSSAYQIFLVCDKDLSSVTLSSDIDFPPGWERALIFNLAVDLSPEYGQPLDQTMYAIAVESKRNIMAAVSRARPMDTDKISKSRNILGGYSN